jgi:hypothetical protein
VRRGRRMPGALIRSRKSGGQLMRHPPLPLRLLRFRYHLIRYRLWRWGRWWLCPAALPMPRQVFPGVYERDLDYTREM